VKASGRDSAPAQYQNPPSPSAPADRPHPPPEAVSDTAASRPLIEGEFTYDSLPDLFRYLCARGESLGWQLSTLAGTFTLLFEEGQPVDIIFRPVRPTGARVGLNALRILFRQEGGQFRVDRDPPVDPLLTGRRSLNTSGEKLLIEMATLDDERTAPAVLAGVTIDSSADLAVVADLPPDEHRTAFLTRAPEVPLTEVLQLFSVSRRSYRIAVSDSSGAGVGVLELSAQTVLAASAGQLRGEAALFALLSWPGELAIAVSPFTPAGPVGQGPELGKLDALLMKALLSGSLRGEPGREVAATRDTEGYEPQTQPARPLVKRLWKVFGRR
jgi:hypothetical protein